MKIKRLISFAFAYQFKKLRLKYSPFFIWIEPTNFCNLKCVTCPQSEGVSSNKGYMKMETYKKILDELARFSPMMISLHLGGEPLLHKEIAEMIRLAKGYNIDVTMASNATLLTQKRAKELIASGLDGITVNFSAERDDFENNFRGARWEMVYGNIRNFLETKQTLKVAKPLFSLQVLNVDADKQKMKDNVRDLEELFKGLPYDSIMLVDTHNWSGNYADMTVERGTVENGIDKKQYYPCSHLWSSMVINWAGDVVPCCRDLQGRMIINNVNKASLEEIWNCDELIEMRRKHRDFQYHEIPICRNCSKLYEGTKPYNFFLKHISKIPLMLKSRLKKRRKYDE